MEKKEQLTFGQRVISAGWGIFLLSLVGICFDSGCKSVRDGLRGYRTYQDEE